MSLWYRIKRALRSCKTREWAAYMAGREEATELYKSDAQEFYNDAKALRKALEDECQWLAEERDRMVAMDENIRACLLDQRRSTLADALNPLSSQESAPHG